MVCSFPFGSQIVLASDSRMDSFFDILYENYEFLILLILMRYYNNSSFFVFKMRIEIALDWSYTLCIQMSQFRENIYFTLSLR